MSLPVGQQRILERIEGRLRETDPRLIALFGIFNRLCHAEAMPWFERVKARPVADRVAWAAGCCRHLIRRPAARMRALLLLPAALIAIVFALLLAVGFPGSGRPSHGPKQPARELVIKPRLSIKPPPLCRFGLRVPAIAC